MKVLPDNILRRMDAKDRPKGVAGRTAAEVIARGEVIAERELQTHTNMEMQASARCNKCREIKPLSDFYVQPNGYRKKRCRKCLSATSLNWTKDHRMHVNTLRRARRVENNARMKLWRKKNPKAMSDCLKRLRKKYPERFRAYEAKAAPKKRARAKRDTRELRDAYIKRILTVGTALMAGDIPDDLIKLKRAHLKMKRALRNENKH